MGLEPQSVAGVCNTGLLSGTESDPDAAADLLIELPHGATRALHFDSLRGLLNGSYPDDLIGFFNINTDVGSPEVGVAVARGLLEARPTMRIRILRSLIPRTFVDCNRCAGAQGDSSAAVTPQVPAYVRDAADVETVVAYHQSYVEQAERAYAEVCGAGGRALIVHTYAPRSVDIGAIDDSIVEKLAAAWRPEQLERWPLRPDVDLITATSSGESLASGQLTRELRRGYEESGFEVGENATYHLHAETLGFHWSQRYPQRVLCLELNRERLVEHWRPLAPLEVSAESAQRMAAPLIAALAADHNWNT